MVGPATRLFVAHYIASYGEVPLWVLSNDLTFGNMSHFFQLIKRGDQNSVCKYLFETTLRTEGDRRSLRTRSSGPTTYSPTLGTCARTTSASIAQRSATTTTSPC